MAVPRRVLLACLLLVVLLGVAVGVGVAALPRLAERYAPGVAARLGVEDLALEVASLRWGELRLADVRVGRAPELSAKSVRITFGTSGLRRGRVDRIEVEGLYVLARMDGGRVSIPSIDAMLRAEPQPEPADAPPLAARELVVEGVHVELAAKEQSFVADAEGPISLAVEGNALAVRALLAVRVTSEELDLAAAGDVRVSGRVAYDRGPQPELRVDVEDLSAVLADLVVEDVHGAVQVAGLPLVTPEPQRLEVARIASGGELTDGLVVFSLDENHRLRVRESRFSAFGGTLHVSGVLDPAASSQRFALRMHRIDLEQLLTEADVPGLAGTGVLDGSLEIEISESGVRLRDGNVASRSSGGWIRYRRPGQGPLDYTAPQGLDLVRTALDNFVYRSLAGTLSGDAGGNLKFALRIEGANPDLFDGHPIELDLNLNGPFLGLLRSSRTLTGIPKSLERRIGAGISR